MAVHKFSQTSENTSTSTTTSLLLNLDRRLKCVPPLTLTPYITLVNLTSC